VYLLFAALSRYSYNVVSFTDGEPAAFDGAGNMIAFMIVFYVGYCYNRFSEQYFLMTGAARLIITCSSTARATFPQGTDDAMQYWRLLNLMQVCCYVGMSPTYSRENLLTEFSKEFDLIKSSGLANRLEEVDPDKMGERAMNECFAWAQELLDQLRQDKKLNEHTFKHLLKDTRSIAQSLGKLNAFQNYVMPFAYSHLISLTSTLFLVCQSALKGLFFKPDASYSFGFTLPFLATLILTLSMVGLVEIGNIISNPFGWDLEDFPVTRFCKTTAIKSRDCITTPLIADLMKIKGSPASAKSTASKSASGGEDVATVSA